MRFIVIDGLDGSGKTTHAELIQKKYLEKGQKVVLRSHPSDDTKYGQKAKKALLGRGKWNKIKATIYYAMVLPVPGGPNRSIPLGGSIPMVLKAPGYFRGHSTTSLRDCLSSFNPPMSSQ